MNLEPSFFLLQMFKEASFALKTAHEMTAKKKIGVKIFAPFVNCVIKQIVYLSFSLLIFCY